MKMTVGLALGVMAAAQLHAQSMPPAARTHDWQFGAVLDAAGTSRALALAQRSQGLQLGHSDLSATGSLGRHLKAELTAVLETHDGRLKKEMAEAWVETRTLPGGLSVRAGRFASQVGLLNERHSHSLDFTERPLAYRAFLGGHWYDDGVRVNLTLPTDLYWSWGAEALRGRKLVTEAEPGSPSAGTYTLSTRLGGDLDRAHSWQLGLSYLNNRRTAAAHEEEDEEAHGHGHGHGARFGGKHLWMAHATWKWAPEGNNRDQQLRVTLEAARVSGIPRVPAAGPRHEALSLSAVWRFSPHWEAGLRTDRLRVAIAHDDQVEPGRLREQALMLAWKPSHLQTVRVQYARQGQAVGFDDPARRSVSLQYILAFGAHGAHSY